MDCIGGTPGHIKCLVECECGLVPHLRDVPARSSIRASGRSRSTTIKQARPVLLRSSRTPPYPSSTVLTSRDPNPACRRCFTSGPPCSTQTKLIIRHTHFLSLGSLQLRKFIGKRGAQSFTNLLPI